MQCPSASDSGSLTKSPENVTLFCILRHIFCAFSVATSPKICYNKGNTAQNTIQRRTTLETFSIPAFPRRRTGDSLHPGRLFCGGGQRRGDCSRCHRNHPALRQLGRDGKRQPLLLRCPGRMRHRRSDHRRYGLSLRLHRSAKDRLAHGERYTPLLRPGHRRTGLRLGGVRRSPLLCGQRHRKADRRTDAGRTPVPVRPGLRHPDSGRMHVC